MGKFHHIHNILTSDGNYLLGGHTTAGVTNWDYLAIKVGKSFGNI